MKYYKNTFYSKIKYISLFALKCFNFNISIVSTACKLYLKKYFTECKHIFLTLIAVLILTALSKPKNSNKI